MESPHVIANVPGEKAMLASLNFLFKSLAIVSKGGCSSAHAELMNIAIAIDVLMASNLALGPHVIITVRQSPAAPQCRRSGP